MSELLTLEESKQACKELASEYLYLRNVPIDVSVDFIFQHNDRVPIIKESLSNFCPIIFCVPGDKFDYALKELACKGELSEEYLISIGISVNLS